MSNFADEPLTKVTVNLYTSDVEWLREHALFSQSLREAVRAHVRYLQEQERNYE